MLPLIFENLYFAGNPVLSEKSYPITVGIRPRISCLEREVCTMGNTSSIILKIEDNPAIFALSKSIPKTFRCLSVRPISMLAV